VPGDAPVVDVPEPVEQAPRQNASARASEADRRCGAIVLITFGRGGGAERRREVTSRLRR
jgi:hypothetical protein